MIRLIMYALLLFCVSAQASEREEALLFLLGGGDRQVMDRSEVEGCVGKSPIYMRDVAQVFPEDQTDSAFIELSVDFSKAIWSSYRLEYSEQHSAEVIKIGCSSECTTVSVESTTEPPHENVELLTVVAGQLLASISQDQIVLAPVVSQSRLNNAANALRKYCESEEGGF